jgi:hypothetical protein
VTTAGVARERCLGRLLEALGATAVGRAFDLGRIRSLADFRAHVPLLSLGDHARRVEPHLGFGLVDAGDPAALHGAGLDWERPAVADIWRGFLGGAGVRELAGPAVVVQARELDRCVDQLTAGDLAALGAEVARIERTDDAASLLEELRAAAPAIVAVPSVYTITWLERQAGRPLDRALPSLRLLLAAHDLSRRARARVAIESAGWIHRSGRLGLPSPIAPRSSFTLAVGSQLIELLPHSELDHEGERVYEGRTILPEEAILGWRYELVVSSPLGCLRMRTDAHVEVVGFDPPTALAPFPRPRVVRLRPPPAPVALEGVSLPGAWLTASVRQAFRPEEPALVAATIGPDPSAVDPERRRASGGGDPFADTELGATRPADHSRPLMPRRLLVQVELQGLGRRQLGRRLAERIDADLRRRSPAYDHLRKLRELDRPQVAIVDPGSFAAAQERRIRSLRGRVGVPVVRVVGRERASIFPSSTYGRVGRV